MTQGLLLSVSNSTMSAVPAVTHIIVVDSGRSCTFWYFCCCRRNIAGDRMGEGVIDADLSIAGDKTTANPY
jgi:hypothetical protein